MDVTALPYYPEFWLLAVGEKGTQAEIRFNASVSHNFPYTEGNHGNTLQY